MGQYEHLKLENQLCFPLYAASREVIRAYRPLLDELDLTYTQYVAMMVLWEQPGISVKDLGAKLFLDSGTLTPMLKTMEKKDLIKRTRSSKDERILIVEPTKAGMALRERASGIPAKLSGCIRLEPEEAAQLYGILYKIIGQFEGDLNK